MHHSQVRINYLSLLLNFATFISRLVVIPLSFLRRLDSLKYTSVVALVAIGYLVILVLAHFIKGDTIPDRGEINYVAWSGPMAFLANLPVIVFAYTCHQNVSILSSYSIKRIWLRCFQFLMKSKTTPHSEQLLLLFQVSEPLVSSMFL